MFHLHLSRRGLLVAALALSAAPAFARTAAFDRWVAAFRPRALARGISEATYDRVMGAVTPDTSVYEAVRAQPEFTEQMWQYINRRCSDWRVITGKERAREYAQVLARVARADCLGRAGLFDCSAMDWFIERARALGVQHRPPAPLLLGRHLLALGLSPGPRVGEILKEVYEKQLDGEVTTVEAGIEHARRLLGRA